MPPTVIVEGLLLDYGGVLTNPLAPVMAAFCRSKGLPVDALAALQRPGSSFGPELEAYERGAYADEDFLPRVAEALGLPAQDMHGFLADVKPDDRMLQAVARLRGHGIPVGLLSNSWALSDYPRELLAEALDGVVISGEVGMRKPEPRIYLHAAQAIGVDPGRCVFVDDTETHLAVAAQQGMTVIHHTDLAQTLRQLEALFGVELASVLGTVPD
jgi:HAD superfamily hydrolase (TIGR01509 family)